MSAIALSRGRPTVFDYGTVHKLEQAFFIGCTVDEACILSGVSRSAYYNRLKSDSDFMDKMSRAQLFMIIKARHTVNQAIQKGDTKVSMWYLERKRKEEFGNNPWHNGIVGTSFSKLTSQEITKIEHAAKGATRTKASIAQRTQRTSLHLA